MVSKEVVVLLVIFSILLPAVSAIKAPQEVYSQIEQNDQAEVIVRYHTDISSPQARSRARAVLNLNPHRQLTDGFSANVSLSELQSLESDPNIESIYKVRNLQVHLDDSVSLINATLAFDLQEFGLNLTGAGQTVCVIDTGVNYSHPDLGGCYGNNDPNSDCKVLGGADFVFDDSDPMDDNGHGTHVAGIVAANGGLKGVAPDSKIIAIKVCTSAGSCSDANIMAGMDWCINNATRFNITTISMSIGADCDLQPSECFSSYCNADPIAGRVNQAVGENISVVISTGNDGSSTKISSPSCIQNVTAVSSSTKTNAMSSFANRNSLVDLLAPGGNSLISGSINSTGGPASSGCITFGIYMVCSGTSMAAPHVSGALSLLRQYSSLTSQYTTPDSLQNTLNSTGIGIYDSASGLNFSRIQVYSALISLDNSLPIVNLSSPSNATTTLERNITFECNATDLALSNMTFLIWNSTGDLINQTNSTKSGASSSIQTNITDLASGVYTWSCLAQDQNHNIGFSPLNYTLIINSIDITLNPSPRSVNTNQTFECNANSVSELTNVTFSVWNSTVLLYNETSDLSGTSNSSTYFYNFTSEGTLFWNCLFTEISGVSQSFAQNYSITYDITAPTLNVTSPQNGSWANSGYFNVSLNENGSCLYSLDGSENFSMNTTDNQNFWNISTNVSQNTQHNVTFFCNDSAGNENSRFGYVFLADLIKPNVTTLAPADGHSVTSGTQVTFEFTSSDNLNISSCTLYLNGISTQTETNISNSSQTYFLYASPSAGSYNWQINCTDQAGNINGSQIQSLTVSNPATTSSGSSSSSSSFSGSAITEQTYFPSITQLSNGYSKSLKPLERIRFSIPSSAGEPTNVTSPKAEHTLVLNSLNYSKANLTLFSSPQNFLLESGQEIKLNLTSPKYYDVLIRLNSIGATTANITLQTISEIIPERTINSTAENLELEAEETTPEIQDTPEIKIISQKRANFSQIGTLLVILMALFILGVLVAKKYPSIEKKQNSKR